MAKKRSLLSYVLITFTLILNLILCCGATDEDRKVYIVYMGSLPKGAYSPPSHHVSLLQDIVRGSPVGNLLVRSYKRSFNGFAARLTSQEAQKLASKKGVVAVFPSRKFQLQTTRSWDFMGLPLNSISCTNVESDVIVGVIDSGIWPESESFSREGFSSPPKKWKGVCDGGENFTCNNKIIGARYYDSDSARDGVGHGSHTASTAAGNIVKDVSFYGVAQGTARGGVPSARIAAYRVCDTTGCEASSILAAFDDAVADGVDIITISIGTIDANELFDDPIAIGAFHAMDKGVLTVQSAGNSGDMGAGYVASVAPWELSVAASSTDRGIFDRVVLGNGKTLVGKSVNSFTLNGTKFPLVHGRNASTYCDEESASICLPGCIDDTLVNGKIVVCDDYEGIAEVSLRNAVGSITSNMLDDVAFVVQLPASSLSSEDLDQVKSYMTSNDNAVANILKSETMNNSDAPLVASFSSRGPNMIIPDITKPDISAPGIEILAAYAANVPPVDLDKRHVKYNIMSGTSMACPHAAGTAAYVKTFHPNWSPSAIKSAIMTTAWQMNSTNNPEAEFSYGSGHINPVEAINPGLVYEASKDDYIKLLCNIYDADSVKQITGDNSSCSNGQVLPKDLNYPSMTVKVTPQEVFTIGFHRTVTNVGLANSMYSSKIIRNLKLNIKVEPQVLSFKSVNEKKSFDVTVSGSNLTVRTIESAALVWSDGSTSVRSPIVVHTFDLWG